MLLDVVGSCCANGRNIVVCYMLCLFAHPVACCWMLLGAVAQSLKPVKLLAPCKRTQQLPALRCPFARSFMSSTPGPSCSIGG